MKYTITESKTHPGHYWVDEDQKISRALFVGPTAEQEAQEYARWKNAHVEAEIATANFEARRRARFDPDKLTQEQWEKIGKGVCPLCDSKIGYCEAGEFCTNDACPYVL